MTHRYIGIPTNTARSCWTQRAVAAADLKAQLAYDKQWRWGQSLFVDGKCVHVGDGSGHSPEDIARLEREIGEEAP